MGGFDDEALEAKKIIKILLAGLVSSRQKIMPWQGSLRSVQGMIG